MMILEIDTRQNCVIPAVDKITITVFSASMETPNHSNRTSPKSTAIKDCMF